jgi:putative ABC transport system permease protein
MAYGHDVALAWRFALREMRHGLRGFRVFLACLTLGVFAIAAVGSLSASIVDGLEQNARAILGGDIEISQTAQDIGPEAVQWLAANTTAVSVSREMRAMARGTTADAQRTIVELKAIAGPYPLYGTMTLVGDLTLDDALAARDGVFGVVAEPELMSRIGVAVGDQIAIGNGVFTFRAVIADEPDRVANAFSLGPRIMMNDAAYATTGLQREGSLIRFKHRVQLSPEADYAAFTDALATAFPAALWRVRNATDAQPSIRRFVERLAVFLTLAGVTALTVGGIGVGIAVQAYLAGKTATIATLKCLGARGNVIFLTYMLQIGVLSVLGIAIGLLLGVLSPFAGLALLADALPVPTEPNIYPAALGLAAAFGVLTALAFSVWPLAQAREIKPAALFRDVVASTRRWPRPGYIVLTGLAAIGLALLAAFGTGQPSIARWMVVGIIVALIGFRFAATGIVAVVRRLPRARNATLRLALANIVRPGAPTASIVVALGVGLTVLVTTALVQGNIAQQVANRIPNVAPSFFFIDIQSQQVAAFDDAVRGAPGFVEMERVPNLRGRLVRINGALLDDTNVPPEISWIKRAELGATYAADLPPRAAIVDGAWWPRDYSGPPKISVEDDVVRELGLSIGDTMTFNILGRDVTAEIASTRSIDWADFGINYIVIFAPGTLEAAPQTHLATAAFDLNAEDEAYRRVTAAFPNVSTVRVRDVIETASALLGRIATAANGTAAITIIAGILVLVGAVAAGHRRRVYDAVILKVLGATRRDVLKAYIGEFLMLGAITATVATLLGTLAAWLVITRVMQADWVFLPVSTIGTAAAGIAIVTALGYAGTWLALSQRPAPVLRAE